MSSREFAEWKGVASELTPLPGDRADAHTMMICGFIHKLFAGKRAGAFKVDDYMLWLKEQKRHETPEEMQERMMAWAVGYNAMVGE